MYHIELRQFPHNHCRFNLTEQELRILLAPWVRERPLELGERKWSPHQARLTILEGPRLPIERLSMGRGWRAAERQGEDVTKQALALAAEAVTGAAVGASMASSASSPAADPLVMGVQLASLLGDDPVRLLEAWRQAATAAPELSPSEALALAEEAVRASRDSPA
jgi:DNA-binding helix-hairpin-helix protein with protein kinase domain